MLVTTVIRLENCEYSLFWMKAAGVVVVASSFVVGKVVVNNFGNYFGGLTLLALDVSGGGGGKRPWREPLDVISETRGD